ncbi:hypothetical protein CP04DC42_0991 [Chlamydia psittaci 04DC42]|nr:hypothetical protein B595_0624 [Chlamydia psittaci 84/55]AFS22778.1 hypothetical protein B600_0623 [Chlamydia psittaci VS225]EPJ20229.1 hypothetical protein CP02DC21_0978 [Chlamydia psittaci 02DC21]EPJ21323.1 hypothetical protein CP02DC23_0270 [Chlamydia psittaci 02DC23]EPJ22074.1 hypothetical protein CP04DC42_0991 [Chlamydia psittaci 04DC42]EPJ29499.1 hypothetical protein CPC1998_0272 [Chlamydia psittaci C19/98]EPJ97660.1 hypothetical protein CP02DC14_1009 [Chlamydia psittaci 02DC14]EPP3
MAKADSASASTPGERGTPDKATLFIDAEVASTCRVKKL